MNLSKQIDELEKLKLELGDIPIRKFSIDVGNTSISWTRNSLEQKGRVMHRREYREFLKELNQRGEDE